MSNITIKHNGITYRVLPHYSRDGERRLCGAEDCSHCRCCLRTSQFDKRIGGLHEHGAEFQSGIPCTCPCEAIKKKVAHICELKGCYFRKEENNGK